jgi:hypothetical protein
MQRVFEVVGTLKVKVSWTISNGGESPTKSRPIELLVRTKALKGSLGQYSE